MVADRRPADACDAARRCWRSRSPTVGCPRTSRRRSDRPRRGAPVARASSSHWRSSRSWPSHATARMPMSSGSSVWADCGGASWPASRSGTGSRCRVRACACSGPCSPAAPGGLFVDTLKGRRSRTVPARGRAGADPRPLVRPASHPRHGCSSAPKGGPISESNWKRTVGLAEACAAIGRPTLRVHDLRHTAASIWLGAGADPKVVQRILGHASAAMTMDLYGHLIDRNLWEAAQRVGGTTGASGPTGIPERRPRLWRERGPDLWCCVERVTRVELATSTLGRWRSTN